MQQLRTVENYGFAFWLCSNVISWTWLLCFVFNNLTIPAISLRHFHFIFIVCTENYHFVKSVKVIFT